MTEGTKIANEVWNMLPDECKVIMNDIKESFIESIISDVDHLVNNRSYCICGEKMHVTKYCNVCDNDN